MKFDEFITKYNGKFVEVGGSANAQNQCVDLANRYIIDVLGKQPILGTNASDFPSKCLSFCDWIPNTPSGIPENGDIIIWDTGAYGHIAIFIEGNASSFKSFDQNYPVGTPAHIQSHNYNGVIGWLRPHKEQTMITRGQFEGEYYNQMSESDKHQHEVRNALTVVKQANPTEHEVVTNANKYSDIQKLRVNLLRSWATNNGYMLKTDCKPLPCPDCPECDCEAQILEIQAKCNDKLKEKDANYKEIINDLETQIEELENISCEGFSGWTLIRMGVKRFFNK